MIVRITGHTKGIGKCLHDDLIAEGHDVVGYSRSNGFDISNPKFRQFIVEESKQADVFINCAWPDGDLPMTKPEQFDGQTEMLKAMIQTWEGNKDKKILNLSSKSCYNESDTNDFMEMYGNAKKEQNKIVENRINVYGPHILNVILGCTDTQISEYMQGNKIDPNELSKWIIKMLLCETMYFQSVTIDATQLNYKPK